MKARCRNFVSAFIAGLVFASLLTHAQAQSRLNDNDVEKLMGNLHEDVKSFRPAFDSALKKSSIRKTSQEKEAKDTAKQLEKQTGTMLETFKHKQKADNAFQTVTTTAQKVDGYVQQLGPQSSAFSAWSKVQADLNSLGPAFGVVTAGNSANCYQQVGDRRAERLVEQCKQVSPSTSSPCNAQNTCKMLTDEIRRGCSLITSNAPSFCAEYR